MKRIEHTEYINVDGIKFAIEFANDYEILFRRVVPIYDDLQEPLDLYERVPTSSKTAIKLFREIERVITKYLKTKKPPMIYFTAGLVDERYSLYKRLAKRLSKEGYLFSEDPTRPNICYAYKT